MKNKRAVILLNILILLLLAGCGKKNVPITENPGQGNTDGTPEEVIDLTQSEPLQDMFSDPEDADIGGVSDDTAPGGVSDDMAPDGGDTVSDDMADISDNGVSSNDVSDNAAPEVNQPMDSNALLTELGVRSNCIYIANMSGKDIKVLTLTFSEGEVRGGEILGGSVLKDGEMFTYAAADINALQSATGLRLTVTATAKDNTVMAFPEVRVINPAGCTVILSRGQSTSENAAGYQVFIE